MLIELFHNIQLKTQKTLRHVAVIGLSTTTLLIGSSLSHAEGKIKTWDHKDWTVTAIIQPSNQDVRVICDLHDKSGGLLHMQISQSNGDAGPPDIYPEIAFTRMLGVTGRPMALADEDLQFIFAFDNKTSIPVQMTWDFEDGRNVFKVPSAQSQELLRAMALRNMLEIQNTIFTNTRLSLAGFSAGYRKMADWCSFSIEGVL